MLVMFVNNIIRSFNNLMSHLCVQIETPTCPYLEGVSKEINVSSYKFRTKGINPTFFS